MMLSKIVKGEIDVPVATLSSGIVNEETNAQAKKAAAKRKLMKDSRKHSNKQSNNNNRVDRSTSSKKGERSNPLMKSSTLQNTTLP
jgi:hypothetical protein